MTRTPPVLISIYQRGNQWVIPSIGISKIGYFATEPVALVALHDLDGLTTTLTDRLKRGNPRLAKANWEETPAVVKAVGVRTEAEFERGARLFHLKVREDGGEVSEVPKDRRRGFGGQAVDVSPYSSVVPREIAQDLYRRLRRDSDE